VFSGGINGALLAGVKRSRDLLLGLGRVDEARPGLSGRYRGHCLIPVIAHNYS